MEESKERWVSNKVLKKTWRSMTSKPFPSNQIAALQVTREEFKKLEGLEGMKHLDVEEWGVSLDRYAASANTVKTEVDGEEKFMIILVDGEELFSFEEKLRHEISHIINNDFDRFLKQGRPTDEIQRAWREIENT